MTLNTSYASAHKRQLLFVIVPNAYGDEVHERYLTYSRVHSLGRSYVVYLGVLGAEAAGQSTQPSYGSVQFRFIAAIPPPGVPRLCLIRLFK